MITLLCRHCLSVWEKSVDKLELAVSSSEYDAIEYRVGIEHSIENRELHMLRKLRNKVFEIQRAKTPYT